MTTLRIKKCHNPEMQVIREWWEVRTKDDEFLFWDESLDKCKAFCEGHGFNYTIIEDNTK